MAKVGDPDGGDEEEEAFGPFTVAEVEECFKAFDLDENGFVGAAELRKLYIIFNLLFDNRNQSILLYNINTNICYI